MLDDLPAVMTVEEAAAALRMTPAGLRRLLLRGDVRGVKIGKRWAIRKDEVRRIIDEGTKPIELAGGRQHPRAVQRQADDEEQGPRQTALFDGRRGRAVRIIG